MTTSLQTFSPKLLQDFTQLKAFFSGKNELQELDKLPRDAFVRPSKDHLYYNRFYVTWIILSTPFKFIAFVFFSTIAYLLECLTLTSLSRPLSVLSKHIHRDLDYLQTQALFGSRFLLPSLNDYQLYHCDIYSLPPIKRESLPLPLLREALPPQFKKVNFSRIGKGLCHGGVNWFNYLFLKGKRETGLQKRTKSVAEYATAIAKSFEYGQPRQAALIQSLYGVEKDLLNLNKKFCFFIEDVSKDIDKILPYTKKLRNGVYYFKVSDHVFSYIKSGKEELVWDPTKGLIELQKPQDLLDILQLYLKPEIDKIFVYSHSL